MKPPITFQFLLILLSLPSALFAQTKSSWTAWEKLYSDKQIKVEIQYKIREEGCQTQKTNKYHYRVSGNVYTSTRYVYWKIKYKDCNGQIIEDKQQIAIGGSEAITGIVESMDYRFMAKSIYVKFYGVSTSRSYLQDTSMDDTDYYKQGKKFFEKEKYNEALNAFLKAIDKKQNVMAYGYVASCYRRQEKPKKALPYLHKYHKHNRLWTTQQLAYTHADLYNYDSAYYYSKSSILLKPNDYSNWYSLSFYALFKGKYYQAIEAAQKTLRLNPKAYGVETNLALGYVLTNQWSKARPIYKRWNNKHFPNDKRTADEVFLKDILDLENAGIRHPDFAKVRNLLLKN